MAHQAAGNAQQWARHHRTTRSRPGRCCRTPRHPSPPRMACDRGHWVCTNAPIRNRRWGGLPVPQAGFPTPRRPTAIPDSVSVIGGATPRWSRWPGHGPALIWPRDRPRPARFSLSISCSRSGGHSASISVHRRTPIFGWPPELMPCSARKPHLSAKFASQ